MKLKKSVNFLEIFLVNAELDTGTCVVEDLMTFLRGKPKEEQYDAMTDVFIRPGLEKAYLEKSLEVSAHHPTVLRSLRRAPRPSRPRSP